MKMDKKRELCDNQEFNLLDSVKHVVQNIPDQHLQSTLQSYFTLQVSFLKMKDVLCFWEHCS